MQISDIFHNCPEQEQQEQQQCNPKDLGSKFPRSKTQATSYKVLTRYHNPIWYNKVLFLLLDHFLTAGIYFQGP